LSNQKSTAIVPARQFRLKGSTDKPQDVSDRLPWNQWVKALRAELGARKGAKHRDGSTRPISQSELAERLRCQLSMVGKWEMKNPQQPNRDNYVKALSLASPALRARAPQDLPGLEIEPHQPDREPLDGAPARGATASAPKERLDMKPETTDVVTIMEKASDAVRAAIKTFALETAAEHTHPQGADESRASPARSTK
jgi:hypothetical protein